MGCADSDEHTGFTYFKSAEAVQHRHAVYGIALTNLGANLLHFRERHGFVGFVVQVERAAAMGLVTHKPVKCNRGAILVGADVSNGSARVDRGAHEFAPVVIGRGGHQKPALSSAHRRKESNFVAGRQPSIPRGEFLIARGYQRRAKTGEQGKAFLVLVEEVRKSGAIRHIDGLLGHSGQFPHTPKEEHPDAQIWQDARHREIVT